MIILNDNELKGIYGGFKTTIINTAVRAYNFIFEVGRTIGSSLRRVIGGRLCPL